MFGKWKNWDQQFEKQIERLLKAFLTRPTVTFRAPYGRFEVKKPVTCSYIGTLNDEGGFLNDPTGNRRFRVCTLTRIDWNYYKDIDPNQVWSQAVQLFKAGETYNLDRESQERLNEILGRYEVDDPLIDFIYESFEIDKDNKLTFTTTATITSTLKNNGLAVSVADRGLSMRISAILTKLGLSKTRKTVNGKKVSGWEGIELISNAEKVFPDGK